MCAGCEFRQARINCGVYICRVLLGGADALSHLVGPLSRHVLLGCHLVQGVHPAEHRSQFADLLTEVRHRGGEGLRRRRDPVHSLFGLRLLLVLALFLLKESGCRFGVVRVLLDLLLELGLLLLGCDPCVMLLKLLQSFKRWVLHLGL